MATLFLNCTKNTELTPLHFARTFCLALSTKNKPSSIDDIKTIEKQFDTTSRFATNIQNGKRMKAANSWNTYRTRFLVKARQLTSSLTFTDVLGRQHSGCKGDYLVESSDGVLRIAPRQIFEDVYVALIENDTREKTETARKRDAWDRREMLSQQEPSSHCKIPTPLPLPPHLTPKPPQPSHDRRYSGLRSL